MNEWNVKSKVFIFFLKVLWPKNGPNNCSLLRENLRSGNLLLFGFLGEEHSLDVGEDTTLGDGDTGEELVQLFVIADGELEVTGDDPGLLVVTGGIAGKLEDLSS